MRKLVLVALLSLLTIPASAKSLHWRALDVTARLDRDGRLHVSERQAIVFDGEWNGGERSFNFRPRQSLAFESITRVENSVERKLIKGDLSKVDQYKFTSPAVLRWRSRMPADPAFVNKEIVYVIDYAIIGALRKTGDTYFLNHDFAFPDRAGNIDAFSLRFDLDPVWRGVRSPIVITRKTLVPGDSVLVPLALTHAGAAAPSSVVKALPPVYSTTIFALIVLALAFLIFDFARNESRKGRFVPPVSTGAIDEAWLDKHLFVLSPEAAGSAMDGKTAAAEVAAVLARMTQEKKVASTVEQHAHLLSKKAVLRLELLVDRKSLPAGERKLIDKFFFGGSTTTDTDKLRENYSGRGFDPAAIVKEWTDAELKRVDGWNVNVPRANFKRDALLLGAGLVLMILAALPGGSDSAVAVPLIIMAVVLLAFSGVTANKMSRALSGLTLRFALPVVILLPFVWVALAYAKNATDLMLHFLTPIAIAAWVIAVVKLTLDLLRIPESAPRIAFRKNLYAARDYFVQELRAAQPRLDDTWYPYLLAFGLGTHVDEWFNAYGSKATSGAFSGSHSSSFGSSGSSSSAGGFTGGGGAFGAAGASGGWAVAAGAMAAGVAKPSSGGGGGGGGGSSGGGGGGGW